MTIAGMEIWNANLVEMVWTAIGLIGLYFVRKQMKRTSEYIESTRKFNGKNLESHRELRLIAYGHFRNASFRLAKTLTIVFVGLIAMVIPNTTTAITPAGIVVTVGLFMIELLIVLPGMLDERQAELMEDDKRHEHIAGQQHRRRKTD